MKAILVAPEVQTKLKKLLFFYGLSLEEITKGLSLEKKKHKLKQFVRQQLRLRKQNPPRGFGWDTWKTKWTLEKEKEVISTYKKLESVWKTSQATGASCFEVACILNSLELLLPEHKHRFRLKKVLTHHLLEKAIKLREKGLDAKAIGKKLKASGYLIASPLKKRGYELQYSKEEKQEAIALYKQGVVPKDMHKYGITASFCAIYIWIREAGLAKLIRKNTRFELRKAYILSDFEEGNWKLFSKLARKLTGDTYRKYQTDIDPWLIRGKDSHLDHKVSIYDAYLRGWFPEEVADKSNLRIIPEMENRCKFTKSVDSDISSESESLNFLLT
jgi:hypothetical protein